MGICPHTYVGDVAHEPMSRDRVPETPQQNLQVSQKTLVLLMGLEECRGWAESGNTIATEGNGNNKQQHTWNNGFSFMVSHF